MALTLESQSTAATLPSPNGKQRRQDSAARHAAKQMAALLELFADLDTCQNIKSFTQTCATLLHRVVQEQNDAIAQSCTIAMVTLENGDLREIGCSEPKWAATIDDWKKEVQSVVLEASAKGTSTAWRESHEEDLSHPALLCHRQLATAWNANRINCVLCHDSGGELQGAILLLVHAKEGPPTSSSHERAMENTTRFLQLAATSLASRIPQLIRLSRTVPQHLYSQAKRFVQARSTRFWCLAATLLFAIGLVPTPYRLAVDCEVQPAVRKILTAPFDGRLNQMPIEEGTEVKAGQILVTLDGRELELELEQAEAGLLQQEKTRDGLMASHDIGKMRLAELEIERLKSQIAALRYRQQKLLVRSPIPGVVLSSPYEQCDGQPVNKGESLFEVAPLHNLLFELAIPQNEIERLREGQSCNIRLNAFPGRKWTGKIQSIHPQAEWKHDKNIFVAEVSLSTSNITPRPGMVGNATVYCDSGPMIWNYLQRPWNQLRHWMGL